MANIINLSSLVRLLELNVEGYIVVALQLHVEMFILAQLFKCGVVCFSFPALFKNFPSQSMILVD